MQNISIKDELRLGKLQAGKVHRILLNVSDNSLGVPWRIPVVVIRGVNKGPTLGITAALHGDELNGISTIFKLIGQVDPQKLSGNLIMVPISNIPGYLKNQRYFSDNVDLNRIMPGAAKGVTSNLYAHDFITKLVRHFNYLLDLHTASHGRVNSLYIRADLESEESRTLAYLQNPQIIVKKFDEQKTLRGWASENGIPSVTIEIGNSNAFQHQLIDETLEGILNTLRHLQMLEGEVKDMVTDAVVCDHSYWIYSKKGGIVDVLPQLAESISAGQLIARVYDVFGQVREEIHSDKPGIVIGKNIRPNCDAGTRILHLGVNIIEPLPNTIPGHEAYEEN